MKKLFTTIIGLAASAMSFAQVSIGVEAGAAYGSMSQYINGANRNATGQVGYKAGVNVNIPLGSDSRFHIQPGVLYRGLQGSESSYYKQSATGSGAPTYESDFRKYVINQVQVPVLFVYKSGDPEYDQNHFFVGVGPSFSYNVGGRIHQIYKNALNGNERTRDNNDPIAIGKGNYKDVAPLNIDAALILGYEFKSGFYTKAYGQYGLVNIHPMADSRNQFTTFEAGISFGFFFKKFQKYKY
ncbi:outer membrane beta-barrel protein [Taibaiella sp. KBW10]|uniref:outer membrane beta-barrel protein n=1 Tax=Taibaiella sp. KBW10 TaxID=2153357 RepID=UPI0013156044|nr:outer membrane beta-barrel protein [Taibaiella sp. KBW10]